jgi:hypothetical protein
MSEAPAPQPINFGGTGSVEMYPAETNDLVLEIARAGDVIGRAWAAAGPALAADEAVVGTGFDDLSAAFRDRYTKIAPELGKLASEAPANFLAMAANGVDIVKNYLQLSHQNVESLRKLDGSDSGPGGRLA